MSGSRVDQYDVGVTVDGIRLPIFDKMTGGEVDSEETTYKPGGMGPIISLGGSVNVGNVTVQKLYDLEQVHTIVHWLMTRAGRGAMVVKRQPLDVDGNAFGDAITYTGTLKMVKPPDIDSESSAAGLLELEMTVGGNGHLMDEPTQVLHSARIAEDVGEEQNGHKPVLSVWDRLRERREQVGADRHLDLEVPNTEGLLGLRLGTITGAKQSQLTERLQKSKSPERDVNLMADYLIAACQCVLVRERRDDEWDEQLDDEDAPMRVDVRLARKFGLPEDTSARAVLRYVFGFAPSPEMAITVAGGSYINWAAAIDDELDGELAGES